MYNDYCILQVASYSVNNNRSLNGSEHFIRKELVQNKWWQILVRFSIDIKDSCCVHLAYNKSRDSLPISKINYRQLNFRHNKLIELTYNL